VSTVTVPGLDDADAQESMWRLLLDLEYETILGAVVCENHGRKLSCRRLDD
jgi:hypothetical protein